MTDDFSHRVPKSLTFEAARDEAVERCQRAMGLTQAGMDETLKKELAQHLCRLSDWSRKWTLESLEIKEIVEAASAISLDWSYAGSQEADREGVPYIKGLARLKEALAAFEKARGEK